MFRKDSFKQLNSLKEFNLLQSQPTQIFLCHTPLHIIISCLVASADNTIEQSLFVVVNDSKNLIDIAENFGKHLGFHFLPFKGGADATTRFQAMLYQQHNVKLLKQIAKNIPNIYIFHDLRPESQALLNNRSTSVNQKFVMLEDGVALYPTKGILPSSLLSIIKRKLAFGLDWKHADELGLHPEINEIRCFFPHLVQKNLNKKYITPLPILVTSKLRSVLGIHSDLINPFSLIALVPHSSIVCINDLNIFITTCQNYALANKLSLIFKLHPRDYEGQELIKSKIPGAVFLPNEFAFESFLMQNDQPAAIIGFRTSSIHILKSLFPDIACFFFEIGDTAESLIWSQFLVSAGINKIDYPL
ncbi:hypothetical protein E0H88_03345 [Acinetobacter sp. ANC 4216]|uniref:polysialyltransferase family glycosyltransferase n=1 Tax=Acinetobacter sp. ANC 4216 TaxID=2529840 RepID=UPI00103BB24F|nr:polysialyltransferase family glycosyltransferase [Acinetobacter sp. ANC 4216]RZJ22736.1 MAG: hypothetical protein EON51_06150 [Acinetobacter sp.]TCB72046.1 hypothetical protein E0H88_03345 [Acinetobacter sp. ANC 4216]